ncbi:hypothetical protein WOA01_16775 [Methylocystis sp. IM2]|uniref:hypothetical protein n=1 Tax=Methylocystis sp. IM2 TaxID=3136563 RepID=UPI0030F642D0
MPRPRNWAPLDLDDFPVPEPYGNGENIRAAALHARDNLLPAAFRGVDCIATPTTQSGWRGPDKARVRLWFAIHPPIDDTRLGAWATSVQLVTRIGLDPATLRTVQPIYTARAPYPEGFTDPIAPEDRVMFLEGSISDRVFLDVDEFMARAVAIQAELDAKHRAELAARPTPTSSGAEGWLDYGRQIIGLGGHVREAAVRTIGHAVLAGASDEEIEDGLLDLIEPYGGMERVDSYGGLDGWLRRTIRDIRLRQSAQDTRANDARSRLRNFLNNTGRKG